MLEGIRVRITQRVRDEDLERVREAFKRALHDRRRVVIEVNGEDVIEAIEKLRELLLNNFSITVVIKRACEGEEE